MPCVQQHRPSLYRPSLCAGAAENSVVAVESIYDALVAEFTKRGAVLLSDEDAAAMGKYIIVDGGVNSAIVGHTAYEVAKLVPGLLERNPHVSTRLFNPNLSALQALL